MRPKAHGAEGNRGCQLEPAVLPNSIREVGSQAKVAAQAIRAELTGASAAPARYSNTCWSLISPDNSVKVGATYKPGKESIEAVTKFISQTKEDSNTRKANYGDSVNWYSEFTADMFG